MRCSGRRLAVRVNQRLTLDAGYWSEVPQEDGAIWRLIEPAERTLFDQVLDYLSSLPAVPGYTGLRLSDEAAAAVAVCLRWGSYLAVLADRDKPLGVVARDKKQSRIADDEMARVNIEASAALERWIEIMRSDWQRYCDLVKLARQLPMCFRSAKRDRSVRLPELAQPEMAGMLIQAVGDRYRDRFAEVDAHPTRALANAIINTCWRNGPVETIHAGRSYAYPLLQRRITPSEERVLLRTTVNRFAQAYLAIDALIHERSGRSWPERVLPFHLVPAWLVTPTGWCLEARTRPVWLPGPEAGAATSVCPSADVIPF